MFWLIKFGTNGKHKVDWKKINKIQKSMFYKIFI